MNTIAMLTEDHAAAKKLMDELEKTTERGVKAWQEKGTELLKELAIHENMEEEIFYPALAEKAKARDIVLEEHHLADEIVDQIKDTPFDDEHWGAKFKVAKENVEHHMEEEEGPMFTLVREVMTKDELEDRGRQMELSKAKQLKGEMPYREKLEV